MTPKIKKIVDLVNEKGIEEIAELMGVDVIELFNLLMNFEVVNELDFDMFNDMDDNSEEEIWYQLVYNQKTNENAIEYIVSSFSDVIYENGDYYLVLYDLADMARWFLESSYYSSTPYSIAKLVLGDDYEDYIDYYHEFTFWEIYDDLTKQNQEHIQNVTVQEFGGTEIILDPEYITPELKKFSEQDEDGNYVITISKDNIELIYNSKKTIGYIMDEDLFGDIGDELRHLYNSAYNDAYITEFNKNVWTELKSMFIDSDSKIESYKPPIGTYAGRYVNKIKITESLDYLIKKYLKDGYYCSNINHFTSYTDFISEGFGCDAWEKLSFRIPDYPNTDLVREYLNNNLRNYI